VSGITAEGDSQGVVSSFLLLMGGTNLSKLEKGGSLT